MTKAIPKHKKLFIYSAYERDESSISIGHHDCGHIINKVLNDGLAKNIILLRQMIFWK